MKYIKSFTTITVLYALFASAQNSYADSYSIEIAPIYPKGNLSKMTCDGEKICLIELEFLNKNISPIQSAFFITSGIARFKFKMGEKQLNVDYQDYFYINLDKYQPVSGIAILKDAPIKSASLLQSPVLRSTNEIVAKLKIKVSPVISH